MTYSTPAWAQEPIYELFVRDFTPEGTFQAIIPRLPELRALGMKTVWLMPVHPSGVKHKKGEVGSPYAVRDYYDVHPDYGTLDDLQALVEAVHDHDMKLMLDLVANHTAWDHPWIAEHPDWYVQDAEGNITQPVDTDWTDTAGLDYARPEVRAAMMDVMRFWIETYDIDGYRCDVADRIPLDFWQDAIAEMRTLKPLLFLAEGALPELHTHGFDMTYSWWTYHELKKVWNGEPAAIFFDAFDAEQKQMPDDALLMRFTTTHDETSWDDTPVALFKGLAGVRAAATVMATIPGVSMIYNGQEVGSDVRLNLFVTLPVEWSQNPEMRTFYEQLFNLYMKCPSLREGTLDVVEREAYPDALVYLRKHSSEHSLIVVNARNRPSRVTLPERWPGAWTQRFGDATWNENEVMLPPYGYGIWIRV